MSAFFAVVIIWGHYKYHTLEQFKNNLKNKNAHPVKAGSVSHGLKRYIAMIAWLRRITKSSGVCLIILFFDKEKNE